MPTSSSYEGPQAGSMSTSSSTEEPQAGSMSTSSSYSGPQAGSMSTTSSYEGPQAGSMSTSSSTEGPQAGSLSTSSSSEGSQDGSMSTSSSYEGPQAGSMSTSSSTEGPQAGSLSISSSSEGSQDGSTAGSRSVGPVALSASDGCQQCVNTLRTCQIDVDCATVSRGKLSVLLKNALDTQNATPSADTPAEFEVDFASALSLLRDNAFTSKQTWFAIEDEFVCLGSISSNGNGCDVSYDDADNHKPSYLQVEKIDVILHVTTFQNTEWKITLNGTEFSYSPAATITNMRDAVTAFQSWLENWGKQESLEIHADSWDDDGSSPTTFDVKVYGNYDEVTGRYTMLSPALIPTFEAVGGIVTDNARNAGVSITLWDIKLKSTDPEPKYDKLLDLLGYGVVGAKMMQTASTFHNARLFLC
ncbi:unnamed protein product [Phytophthora fragariaefolia]|uniref:Unnamed protein product n=1 Tax=Phytophthora fragariaefolia TaxID=1490495 RepID=A0A9W6YD47_9STRA|nr:unnamed protein product [Phytophthora fragariaefolia]